MASTDEIMDHVKQYVKDVQTHWEEVGEQVEERSRQFAALSKQVGEAAKPVWEMTKQVGGATKNVVVDVGTQVGGVTKQVGGVTKQVGGATKTVVVDVGNQVGGVTKAVVAELTTNLGDGWNDAAKAVYGARESLAAGAVAGAIGMTLLYPLDVGKTIIQASTMTSQKAINAMVMNQGNYFGGIVPSLLKLPSAVVTFAAFEVVMQKMKKRQAPEPISRAHFIVAACISDIVGAVWVTPLESIKQKIQIGVLPNFEAAMQKTVKKPGANFQGFLSVVARDCTYRALHLILLDELRKMAKEKKGEALSVMENIGLSTGVAAVAAVATNPFDVAKTRVMAQRYGYGKTYSSLGDALTKIVTNESAQALFRGVIPRVGYVAGSSLIFLLAYDKIVETMGSDNKEVPGDRTLSGTAFVPQAVPRRERRSAYQTSH